MVNYEYDNFISKKINLTQADLLELTGLSLKNLEEKSIKIR